MPFTIRRCLPVALAAAVLAVPAIAIADNTQVNDAVTNANTTKDANTTGNASVRIIGNNAPNGDIDKCNVDSTDKATVTLSSNQTWLTISSPGSVQIDTCGNDGAKTIAYALSATAPPNGVATISTSTTGGKAGSMYNEDSFTVTVSGSSGGSTLAPPTVSGTLSGGTTGSNGWYTAAPTVNWTLGGGTATSFGGICVDGSGDFVSSNVLNTATDVLGTTVQCTATNAAGTGTGSVQYKLDDADPQVSVTGVSNSGSYEFGGLIPAAGCSATTDPTPGSGVAVSASLEAHSPALGINTATCSGARDYAGRSGSASVIYSILYGRDGGIRQPINADGSSKFSRGKVVPVKFGLKNDETIGADGVNTSSGFTTGGWTINKVKISCDGGTEASVETVPSATPSTVFRYDPAADQYIYNADFREAGVGSCWKVRVSLGDGSPVLDSAQFQIGK